MFLGEECITKALVVLAQKHVPAATLDRILYFHAAQADRLLHDTVIEILLPLQAHGITQIDVLEIQRPLKKLVDTGKTRGKWSEPTIIRIAQGLLSALRDFGVLQGAVKTPRRVHPISGTAANSYSITASPRSDVDFSQKSMDPMSRKAISSVPKLANRAPFAFVVDPFLVRTADYALGHRDR
jgi:Putative inner membrane protein (DUF1819)